MEREETPAMSTALVPVPVIELHEEWLGWDPRHVSSETLSLKLRMCAPGTAEHRALLHEQRRRREQRAARMEE